MVKSLFPIKGLEASLSKIVMKSAPVQEKKKRHKVTNHNNAKTMSKTLFLNPMPSLNPKQVLKES